MLGLGLIFVCKVQSTKTRESSLYCDLQDGKKKVDFLHVSLTFFNANSILQQDQIYPRASRKNLRGGRKVKGYYGKVSLLRVRKLALQHPVLAICICRGYFSYSLENICGYQMDTGVKHCRSVTGNFPGGQIKSHFELGLMPALSIKLGEKCLTVAKKKLSYQQIFAPIQPYYSPSLYCPLVEPILLTFLLLTKHRFRGKMPPTSPFNWGDFVVASPSLSPY